MKAAMQTRIRPIGDHLVVVPEDCEEMWSEGTHVKDHGAKLWIGTVIMAGPDVQLINQVPRIQQGQRVLYNRCAGAEVSFYHGIEFAVIREGDVCGVVEEVSELQRDRERNRERELVLAN